MSVYSPEKTFDLFESEGFLSLTMFIKCSHSDCVLLGSAELRNLNVVSFQSASQMTICSYLHIIDDDYPVKPPRALPLFWLKPCIYFGSP